MLELLDKPGFLIVAAIGILIFGAKRLPDSARALGRSLHILKAETKGLHDEPTSVPAVAAAPAASAGAVTTPLQQIAEAPRAV